MGLDQNIFRLNGDEREEVAYFRKVNFLHLWVQEHLNEGKEHNCDEIPMHLEAIAGLARTCHTVINHPERAPDLLPTTAGFFFGGTEYDEGYIEDVKEVLEVCHRILIYEKAAHPAGGGKYVYWSWW